MNFAKYWGRKVAANRGLAESPRITMAVDTFRTELEKAYLAGQADVAAEKAQAAAVNPFEEILQNIAKGLGS